MQRLTSVDFASELQQVLPPDLPHRETVVEKAAVHLAEVARVNEYMNLTRILSPYEAAVKHVLDSVIPWRHFRSDARILDAGTGAGFPGIPLATVLPEARFLLADSVQKKARFVEGVVDLLALANVTIYAERAETVVERVPVDLITARALAPIERILQLFRKPLRAGVPLLLYRGKDAELDVAESRPAAERQRVHMRIVDQYRLPGGLGLRTIVELRS